MTYKHSGGGDVEIAVVKNAGPAAHDNGIAFGDLQQCQCIDRTAAATAAFSRTDSIVATKTTSLLLYCRNAHRYADASQAAHQMHRPWIRRLIAGALLLWLGLLQFPLPLRAPVDAKKDLSVPFPCMHRACGCASAKECWTSCCCTSKEERIAFARKHLGYVPQELADAAEKTACTRHSCCSKKAPAKPKPHSSVVILSAALECKGIAAGWSVFSIAVPTTLNTPAIVTVCTVPDQAVVTLEATAESPAFDPLTPPPRSRCCATAFA